MEDKKLKQKCFVILEDCFKGYGAVLGYNGYNAEDEGQIESVNSTTLPINRQSASNSNEFKEDSLISDKESETWNSKICDTKQPLNKPDKKKQPESKANHVTINAHDDVMCLSVSENSGLLATSTNNLGSDSNDGKQQEPVATSKFILDPNFGKLSKPETSTNELILDPQNGKLCKSAASNVDYILNSKDRKLSGAATLTNNLILDLNDKKLSKPAATSTDNLILDSKDVKNNNSQEQDDLLVASKDRKMYSPVGSADELISDPKEGKLFTNPLCSMPLVGLTMDVGIGYPLPSLSAQCVLTCLDECKNLMTSEYAEFCSAVVKTAPLQKKKRMVLPMKDDRIIQLMQIKWKSKSSVKQIPLSDSVNAPTLTANLTTESGNKSQINQNIEKNNSKGNQVTQYSTIKRKRVTKKTRYDLYKSSNLNSGSEHDTSLKRTKMSLLDNDKKKVLSLETGILNRDISTVNSSSVDSEKCAQLHTKRSANPMDSDDDEMRTVTKKTAFEISEASYDPDDTRGMNKSEEKVVKPREITRGKASSHVLHELRRLNVAVFDMPTSVESVVCMTPDICRLGCVCSSLLSRVVRDNCGIEKCMFGCICVKNQSFNRGNQSYTWVQNKAKENLAKEERSFKQTVVRSGKDDLILVEGKRKREIKMPKKYSDDFLSSLDLRQSKTSKDCLFPDEEISNNVGSSVKQAKRRKLASNVLYTNAPLSTDENNSPNTSPEKEPLILVDSARTAFYNYKSSKAFQPKRKQLKTDKTIEKIDAGFFKIASIQSLDQNDWEDSGTKDTADSVAPPSCSYLFDPEYMKENPGRVNILPWDALNNDIVNGTAFVWYQPSVPIPKVYLTNSPTSPFNDCLSLLWIDVESEVFKSFPNYLKALKTGYLPGSTPINEVGWVVRLVKSYWMIVGDIQRKLPNSLSEQPEKSEQTYMSGEVDILPTIDEDYPSRWWVMDLGQNFDLIYFMDFKKALTRRQMKTLLRLSNEYSEGENKVHRILLNRQRPKFNATPLSCPDFGAYSVSNHPNKVFIGPYHSFNEPKFQVYSQKAAPNGKTQFFGVPLFYCGVEECVRVNSQGVMSLHSESLPDVYVEGFWYQSCGNNIRESSEKPQLIGTTGNRGLGSSTKDVALPSSPEILHTDDEDNTSTEVHDNDDKAERKLKEKPSDVESSVDSMEDVDKDEESSSDISVEDHSNDPQVEDSNFCRKSAVSSQDKSDDDESDIQSGIEEGEPRLVYMIPNDSNIGYVTLTYLPGGTISVPHFTETATLKFYRHRSEVVNELNRLIHRKLSCLSRKCSVFLQDDDVCNCVQWSFSKNEPICERPKFTAEIFNGFFMLTNYGLLDLRSAEESIVQKLGKDWVDWMKNDQIRLKLQHWKSKEEQGVLENKLKTILSANKDLPLFEVLSKATDEIAKLKAEDQLLDYESQSQKLMKETLISSLCRKLEGIPVDVVPKFLEHLEFSLLWEVLECMNNQKSILLSVSKPATKLDAKSSVKKKHGKKRTRPRNVTTRLLSKAAPSSQTSSQRRKALQYIERLREEIRQEEEQKLKSKQEKKSEKNEQTSQKKLQVPPQKIKTQDQILQLETRHNEAASPKSNPSSSFLPLKEGIACSMSSFSRINICVEEGGITYSPVTSPPLLKSPCPSRGSPEKPNILRKSKGPVRGSCPAANQSQRQARKQILQNKQEEGPLYLEDPVTNIPVPSTTPVISDFDPISSLCITSVSSGAKSATSCSQEEDELYPSDSSHEHSSTLGQGPQTTSVMNTIAGESSTDPVSSLRIANVFSTRDVSDKFPHTNLSSTPLHSDPVSSLCSPILPPNRASSVLKQSSALSASKATGDLSTLILKSKGLETSFSSEKTNSAPFIGRSITGSSQNTCQVITIPRTLLPRGFVLSSKHIAKQVKLHSEEPGLPVKVKEKVRTVHVMKDKSFITCNTKVPTDSKTWNQSLLNRAAEFIKQHSDPESESSN